MGYFNIIIPLMNLERAFKVLTQFLQGKEKAIELCILCLLAKGHLLIEDLPGIGKTTLALSLAKVLGLSFGRIQGTSDLLPSDITGTSVYNKSTGKFEFHKGPIFNHIVLIDEINRTPPKTQSALLEPMEEGQVTVDGQTYPLPQPFFVIATQNPIEYYGTYPLPEAQLDRFLFKISIGYPPREVERKILKIGSLKEALISLESILSEEEILNMQREVKNQIYVSEKILDYLLDLIEKTRKSAYLLAGLSTRGALSLLLAAKARAYFYKRDFVIPEDLKEIAPYSLPHRLIFKEEYKSLSKEIVKEIIESTKVPI